LSELSYVIEYPRFSRAQL